MKNTVELLGYYGSDETVALSAWTSTSRELNDEKRARIPALLKMLAVKGHHTPFEKSMLHFLVTTDVASHIHILKHRIAVPVNAESARYKELKEDKAYIPDDWPQKWRNILAAHIGSSQALYHTALAELEPTLGRKRAKESARFFLPYASQITADVSFNFRSFAHFYGLRGKDDAQKEIHAIADAMLECIRNIEGAPFAATLEAFGMGR